MSRVGFFQPVLGGPSDKDVEAAKAVLDAREDAMIQRLKDSLVVCTSDSEGKGCGATQRVADTKYLQTHWYTEPYGCTGGDYWNRGEGQFVCNGCGKITRLYDEPEITNALKSYAAEQEDVWDR